MEDSKKELHKGHRQRLIDKFIKDPNCLTEHELMELLLFFAIPQKNVNGEAHRLIDNFGNVPNVLNAPTDYLTAIDGVGKNAATFLNLVGKLIIAINERKYNELKVYSFDSIKDYLINLYKNSNVEIFTIFYLNKQNKITNKQSLSNENDSSVKFTLADFIKKITTNKPYAVVIAHNHCSNNVTPSKNDDDTTAKLYMILQLNGVHFYDHIIVCGDKTYSYFNSGKLELIKNEVDNKLI